MVHLAPVRTVAGGANGQNQPTLYAVGWIFLFGAISFYTNIFTNNMRQEIRLLKFLPGSRLFVRWIFLLLDGWAL